MTSYPQPTSQKPIDPRTGFFSFAWQNWFNKLQELFGDNVDGSGTAGTIAKWSDSDTLTDSIITEASSKISVTTGTDINDFSDDATMADESQDALVTEYAVVNFTRSKLKDYDEISITRDTEDNITQLLYKRSSVTKVTEDRTYNQYGHINTQVFTGEITGTYTHAYESNNEVWNGVS